jgi:hypothetical protein
LLSANTQAQRKNKQKEKGDAKSLSEKEKSYNDIIGKCHKSEGLFTLYRDTVSGKTYLELREDQLNKEFIYFSYVSDGVLDAGFFRGAYMGSRIVEFQRHYERVEIIAPNINYYFDETTALSKASDANINTPVLSSLKIEGLKSGRLLLDGDAIFLSEDFQMIKPPSGPNSPPGMLGNLSKEKSRVLSMRNYPENSDVMVAYVYENRNPLRGGSPAVDDPRFITVEYQHSLIEVPKNDFQPRFDDPRIGYFTTEVTDMTSFSQTPYRDVIHRWNLVKKDPETSISEPVNPIVWWIENTTPVEFRATIKEGVERWNLAFEKAGFRNAIVVKEQPDDANWDAGDIRYNVLRWTSSPEPPFGGYGPSFVNPRTGEILGADIMLEFVFITNRLFNHQIFNKAAITGDEDFEAQKTFFGESHHACMNASLMHHNLLFGKYSLQAMNFDQAAQKEFIKQGLYYLVLHEVGHTLGLTHNMKASSVHSLEDLKRADIVEAEGLCNSVMEYPAVLFPDKETDHNIFFDGYPRAYDHWAIEYGYSPSLDEPEAEKKRLDAILSRSNDSALMYGNDADDMRSSGKGIDPRVNINDLSSEPVAFAIERVKLIREVLAALKTTYSKEGQSYHELRNAFLVASGVYAAQMRIITRQIGGVYVDRSFPEQNSPTRPFEPVPAEKQKEAMQALSEYLFAPDAFRIADDLYNYLQIQRRGFNHFSTNEDPRLHDRVQYIQSECLGHLLHPDVLKRITDSRLYGNKYGLDEMFTDLSNSIFQADLRTPVNTYRQNLQINYVNRLIAIMLSDKEFDNVSRSMAALELKRVEQSLKVADVSDRLTRAHREHLKILLEKAFAAK